LVNNNNISTNSAAPVLGLILGSGIELDDDIITDKIIYNIDTSGIHKKIMYGCKIGGKQLLVFKGRRHYYEGHTINDMLGNVHAASENGVRNIIITNAAGGLNENFCDGDLMLITSHIDFNEKLLYDKKFEHYSKDMQDSFRKACSLAKVKLHEGSYGFYTGPTYETKAEIRFQKKIGLDAAGMSTVPEVYEASKLGMNVMAVSVITNLLKENAILEASHDDVLLTAQKASSKFNKALQKFISLIG
jgi:purine-nucleoside phosphorylase